MSIAHLRAVLAIDSRDNLGEGPVWDSAAQRLLWSDHQTGVIHEAKSDGAARWCETRRWELGRPIAAAIPRAAGGLVVAAANEFVFLSDAGGIEPFARLDIDLTRYALNDAKCDPQGRLWAGTLAKDFSPSAGLYRIDPDGRAYLMLEKTCLSNGLDWSPDGSVFYFIDSLSLSVDAFDFDQASGAISNRRSVITIKQGEGGANGMTVDREGALWVAMTGGGEVNRYSPDGLLLARVKIGTAGATSCAFGGEDGADLFVTSRSGRMPEVAQTVLGLKSEMMDNDGPEAGGLFVCRPGPTAPPATPFAG